MQRVFGQGCGEGDQMEKTMRVGLYARVSTHDQQTLPMQLSAMREYAERRGWKVVKETSEIGSGAEEREKREELLKAARRKEIDAVVVWRLDRWGRSLIDLVTTLGEMGELGLGFVSLREALDLTTPTGRAMAGLLAVFAEFERDLLRERVKAGIAEAREQGRPHGRPRTASLLKEQVEEMFEAGMSKSEIARRLSIGRTSVRRMLQSDSGLR